jgi:nuclease S1
LPKTAPWHYVDVPLDEPAYDSKWSADDPKKGFVVDKIAEFRLTLKDTTKSLDDRRFALRFLIHLVGDMHMPIHVGDNHDRGGNDTQVRWFDRGTNMHSLWDSGIIDHVHQNEAVWLIDLERLNTAANRAKAEDGNIEDWATESLLAARAAYQVPGAERRIKPVEKLADAYFDVSLPVVRERLYRGGGGWRWCSMRHSQVDDGVAHGMPRNPSVVVALSLIAGRSRGADWPKRFNFSRRVRMESVIGTGSPPESY